MNQASGCARDLAQTLSVSGAERDAVELAAARFRALGFDDVEIDRVGNADTSDPSNPRGC